MAQDQLSWPELLLTSTFEAHREFLDLIEGGLRDSLLRKAQDLRAVARAAKNEDEYDELMSEVYVNEKESEEGRFMMIAFNSFFAASFALFEHTLVHICKQAQREANYHASVSERSRLSSAEKYLVRLGIEFPSQRPEWEEIERYKEIRNKIMHEGARIPEGNRRLLTYVREKQVVSTRGRHALELTRAFCEEALENLKQFILETHRAYSRWRQAETVGGKA